MRDVLRLRARILKHAAICVPLAVPIAACAKEDPASSTTVNVPPGSGSSGIAATSATPSTSSAPSATPVADSDDAGANGGRPPLPMSMRMPSCPNGAFCATKADISKFATKTSAKTLDCPTEMESRERPDALAGMPRPSYARIYFEEESTKGARSDAGTADKCCYRWAIPCPGGRPFMHEDAPVVADVRHGAGWMSRSPSVGEALSREARTEAASAWLAMALSEHASVASFARATIELMAVGAPMELVAAHQRAALDEVRHAERCFELARAYGGDALEPGPLPALSPRETSLERLALDTFVEGCVGETLSALGATRAAEDAPHADANVWRMLAADETKHAALAWKTLAWILPQTNAAFRARLVEEADARAAHARASDDERGCATDAWREIIIPTLRALAVA